MTTYRGNGQASPWLAVPGLNLADVRAAEATGAMSPSIQTASPSALSVGFSPRAQSARSLGRVPSSSDLAGTRAESARVHRELNDRVTITPAHGPKQRAKSARAIGGIHSSNNMMAKTTPRPPTAPASGRASKRSARPVSSQRDHADGYLSTWAATAPQSNGSESRSGATPGSDNEYGHAGTPQGAPNREQGPALGWVYKTEQLSRLVSSIGSGSVKEVYEKASLLVQKMFHARSSAILMLNKQRTELHVMLSSGEVKCFASNRGIAGHVARSGQSICTENAVGAPQTMYDASVDRVALEAVPETLMAVPLYKAGSGSKLATGCIMIANKVGRNAAFSTAEEAMLRVFARQVGLALTTSVEQSRANAKMTRLRDLDDLTHTLAHSTTDAEVANAIGTYGKRLLGAQTVTLSILQQGKGVISTRYVPMSKRKAGATPKTGGGGGGGSGGKSELDDDGLMGTDGGGEDDLSRTGSSTLGGAGIKEGGTPLSVTASLNDVDHSRVGMSTNGSHGHTHDNAMDTHDSGMDAVNEDDQLISDILMEPNHAGDLQPVELDAIEEPLSIRARRAWDLNMDHRECRDVNPRNAALTGAAPVSIGEVALLVKSELGETIGVLEAAGHRLTFFDPMGFDHDEIDITSRVVRAIASTLERVRLLSRLSASRTLVPGMGACLAVDDACRKILDCTKQLLDCDDAELYIITPDGKSVILQRKCKGGVDGNISIETYPLADVAIRGRTVVIPDVSRDLEYRSLGWPKMLGYKPKQVLVAPIQNDKGAATALLQASHSSGQFRKADVYALGRVCREVGPALDKILSFQTMVRENATVTSMFKDVRALFGDLDISIVLERLTEAAKTLLDCSAVSVFLVEGPLTKERHGMKHLPMAALHEYLAAEAAKVIPVEQMAATASPRKRPASSQFGLAAGVLSPHQTQAKKEERIVESPKSEKRNAALDILQGGRDVQSAALVCKLGPMFRIRIEDGFAGWCARNGQTCNVTHPLHDDRGAKPSLVLREGKEARSVICMPLWGCEENTLIGVVQCENKSSGEFDQQDELYLSFFASMAAVALEITGIYPYLRHMEVARSQVMKRFRGLIQLDKAVLADGALSELDILSASIKGMRSLVIADTSELFVLDRDSGVLLNTSIIDGQVVKTAAPDAGITAWVAEQGEVAIVEESTKHPAYYEGVDHPGVAVLAVPVFKDGELFAVLHVTKRKLLFDDVDEELLIEFGNHLILALDQCDLAHRVAAAQSLRGVGDGESEAHMIERMEARAASLVGAAASRLYTVDHRSGIALPTIHDSAVAREKSAQVARVVVGKGVVGSVAERGQLVNVAGDEVPSDGGVADSCGVTTPESVLCAPGIGSTGRTEVVLCCVDRAGGAFTKGDELVARVATDQMRAVTDEAAVRRNLLRGVSRMRSLATFLARPTVHIPPSCEEFAVTVIKFMESSLCGASGQMFFIAPQAVGQSSVTILSYDARGKFRVIGTEGKGMTLPGVVEQTIRTGQVTNGMVPLFETHVAGGKGGGGKGMSVTVRTADDGGVFGPRSTTPESTISSVVPGTDLKSNTKEVVNVLASPLVTPEGSVIGALYVRLADASLRYDSEDEDFLKMLSDCIGSGAETIRETVAAPK